VRKIVWMPSRGVNRSNARSLTISQSAAGAVSSLVPVCFKGGLAGLAQAH